MQIKIKRIGNGKLPEYKTAGSVGADCYAHIEKQIILRARSQVTIPLGFAVEIPEGYEMQIRGRSGLASRNGIEGFQGTIDSDYRGEVCAILLNNTIEDFIIEPGDRIAQAVVAPVIRAEWNEVEKLSDTERGTGGFGSTGVSENKEIKVNYPYNVDKFYEPFENSDYKEVEKLIGKKVIIDNSINGTIANIFESKGVIKSYTLYINIDKGQDFFGLNFAVFSFVEAFQRVTIDEHRFGKEMQFETEKN